MLALARQAAEAAGAVIARYFHDGVEMREKGPADLVSQADIEAELAIARVIHAACPTHAILGEECHSAAVDAEHLWIVDPLDGTTNFAHGVPHFAVSIACHVDRRPLCAVIHNPITGDWYTAERGGGAFANGRRTTVNAHRQLSETLVAFGFVAHSDSRIADTLAAVRRFCAVGVHGARRNGAASLDLVGVGLGRFGAYFEHQLSPWDFAAGALFVQEAGGRVTTLEGRPLPVALSSLLATNGPLHAEARRLISEVAPTADPLPPPPPGVPTPWDD